VVTAGLAVFGLVAAAGCGDAAVEATPDQEAVCGGMQSVVDQLEAGRGLAAMTGLEELVVAVGATEDAELQRSGRVFLDAISRPVDYESMTVEESVALGDEVLVEASAGLDALGDRCAAVGLPIEVDRSAMVAGT